MWLGLAQITASRHKATIRERVGEAEREREREGEMGGGRNDRKIDREDSDMRVTAAVFWINEVKIYTKIPQKLVLGGNKPK